MFRSIYLIVPILIALTGCSGCSKSGKRKAATPIEEHSVSNARESAKNIIQMEKTNGGTYDIPISVNGVKMNFIFDTGASSISISDVEAIFLLKQGKLTEVDFLGQAEFSIANGDIVEGSIINLKEVKIGNKVLYNVRASIMHNLEAPLLLGQSALEQFGTITIDNKNHRLILE